MRTAVALVMAAGVLAGGTGPATAGPPAQAVIAAQPSTAQLQEVSAQRIFFGHQSVGWNLIDGMNSLYSARGVTAPNVVDVSAELPAGGVFAQKEIGSNGDPAAKIDDFATTLRDGLAEQVNIAYMKLCFVDFTPGTPVRSLFTYYRQTIDALSAEYPGLVLVHVTAPLTTNDPASNLVRQRYNAMLRKQYAGTGRLFDLARVESTRPDGSRVTGKRAGKRYYALYRGYASDDGHLNAKGAKRAAREMIAVLAGAGA